MIMMHDTWFHVPVDIEYNKSLAASQFNDHEYKISVRLYLSTTDITNQKTNKQSKQNKQKNKTKQKTKQQQNENKQAEVLRHRS